MMQFAVALIGGGNVAEAHVAAPNESAGRVGTAAVVDSNDAAGQRVARVAGGPGFASTEALRASPRAAGIRGAILAMPPNVRLPIAAALLAQNVAILENTFAFYVPAMCSHWMSDPQVSGGGSFIDRGGHSLDLFLHLVGEAEVPTCHVPPRLARPRRVERDGAPAEPCDRRRQRHPKRVVGTVAAVHRHTRRHRRVTPLRLRPPYGTAAPNPQRATRKIEVTDASQRFALQLQAFADAVVSGARPPLARFREALVTAAPLTPPRR